MSGGYTIENGEIKLALNEADFAGVLEDVSECRDLLEPHIRVVDNTVIFRDSDIKLIEPELFFIKNFPEWSPSKELIRGWLIGILLLTLFSLGVGVVLTDGVAVTLMAIAGIVIGGGLAIIHMSLLRNEYHTRHRRALYAKAKLLSFFYMNVLEEMTTSADRMDRTFNRLNREYLDLKERHRDIYSVLTTEQKVRFGQTFPDGDDIEERKAPQNKYH